MALNKEDQKYYEDYFSLFLHPAWKTFEDELKVAVDNLNKDLETADAPEVFRIQGQIKELNFMLNFRQGLNNAYEDLKEIKEDQ